MKPTKNTPTAETPAEETKVVVKKKGDPARAFTYIGKGEGSPHIINFMGKQVFVRGKLTEVTDPELLAKLPGVSTFIEGEVEPESLYKIDVDAKDEADKRRAEDMAINAKFSKKFRVE